VTGISNIKAVRRGGIAVFAVLLAAAFLVPSSALAQGSCSQANSDPTEAQYCSPAGTHENGNSGNENQGVAGENESSAETPVTVEPASTAEAEAVQESSSSSLPFTGLDVGVLAIVALLLAGTGFLLRRLSAPRDTRS
jgi:hypothetical protein